MYEEIGLPVACFSAGAARCVPGAWLPTIRGVPGVRMATHFRFRPAYDCDDFLDALAADTREIWHPLKRRECVATAVIPLGGARGGVRGWPIMLRGRPRPRSAGRPDPDPADEEEE